MKFVDQRDDVMVCGAESVEAFTIKASAKAFQILAQNLYSNPLGSMIRELSTNAYDAHVESGKKDIPFVITLPNSLEPTFKIRDYGTGLSENDILHVYTTFFESTKTDSNDVVGCLGLGSKSPFGVADSFTITSYQNGKKIIYSAFLNDQRIPSIAKFGEFDTIEENGLEVEVAIKEDDFRVFNREVNNQLKYFSVKPCIYGNNDFKWDVAEKYLYEGSNWKMVKDGDSVRLLQGQIQYPVSIGDMGKEYDNAPEIIKAVLNSPVLFEVPIGDVNIAPSREALSYDERTSKNIIKAAEKIAKELPHMISLAINECKTEYEARLKCYEITNSLRCSRNSYRMYSLASQVDKMKDIKWHGKAVSSRDIHIEEASITSARNLTKTYNGRYTKSRYYTFEKRNASAIKDSYWAFQATDLKTTLWVYTTENDKAVDARVKQHVNDINMPSSSRINIIETKVSVEKLAAALGLKPEHFVIASKLDKVRRVRYTKNKPEAKFQIPMYQTNSGNSVMDMWPTNKAVDDLNELTGFYVDMERFNVLKPNGTTVSSFKRVVIGAIELGFIKETDEIFGIRKVNSTKTHRLVNLFDHIVNCKKTIALNPKYELGSSFVVNKFMTYMTETKKIHDLIEDGSPAKKITAAIISNDRKAYSSEAKELIDSLKLYPKTISLKKEAEDLDTRYEMITQLNHYFDGAIVAKYINQIDKLTNIS